jgi:hypothetical protein
MTMSPNEIEAAFQAAFNRCEAASCPLSDSQKQILLQAIEQIKGNSNGAMSDIANPLDELIAEELQTFLEFVKVQEEQNRSWKAQLLNDWLHENNSGAVQFIRDKYGLQWLNRIESYHFHKYAEEDILKLKEGDRIEVCNGLWEWVQENSPCPPQWFPCTVVRVDELSDDHNSSVNCIVRFSNGTEYEIQGIYDWNRYNWRWLEG